MHGDFTDEAEICLFEGERSRMVELFAGLVRVKLISNPDSSQFNFRWHGHVTW